MKKRIAIIVENRRLASDGKQMIDRLLGVNLRVICKNHWGRFVNQVHDFIPDMVLCVRNEENGLVNWLLEQDVTRDNAEITFFVIPEGGRDIQYKARNLAGSELQALQVFAI